MFEYLFDADGGLWAKAIVCVSGRDADSDQDGLFGSNFLIKGSDPI